MSKTNTGLFFQRWFTSWTPILHPVTGTFLLCPGLFQEESAEQCSLLLPPSEELPDWPHQPQPLPALPAAEVSGCGHVTRWWVPDTEGDRERWRNQAQESAPTNCFHRALLYCSYIILHSAIWAYPFGFTWLSVQSLSQKNLQCI